MRYVNAALPIPNRTFYLVWSREYRLDSRFCFYRLAK